MADRTRRGNLSRSRRKSADRGKDVARDNVPSVGGGKLRNRHGRKVLIDDDYAWTDFPSDDYTRKHQT